MMRLILIMSLLLCIVGCPWRQAPSPTSVVSVAISGDVGIKFDAVYTWSDEKADTFSDVIRGNGNDGVSAEKFHNGIPDDRRITSLTIKSLSGTGKLGVVVKRKGEKGETVIFEGLASGESAMISYKVP